jgi:uncharacterized protein with HEPN domain
MKHRNSAALKKIVDEAEYIIASIEGKTADQFAADETLKRAITMSLINIGELTNAITDDFKDANPNIKWRQIRRTRDKIAHHYIELDHRITWETASSSVPELKEQIETLLSAK